MAIIGFIGTGEIASAMVNGITNQGHKIYVSKRGIKYAAKLALLNDVQITSNQELIDKSDIIILCLLKNTAEKVLPKLNFKKDKKIISNMEELYENKSLSKNDLINLAFSLGKAHDKLNNFDKAFSYSDM